MECTSWLPNELGTFDYPALYRFTPDTLYEQYGYNRIVNPDTSEVTTEWIYLGTVSLNESKFLVCSSLLAATLALLF